MAASNRSAAPVPAGIVDTHHHILPPRYVDRHRDRILAIATTFPKLFDWTPAQSIEAMDKDGVGVAATSMSAPGVWFGDDAAARATARDCNEFAAEMARDYPGRFRSFAALPFPDVDGALKEIEYASDTLGADGFVLLTSYANRWPGDQSFYPLFEELNRRKSIVFFHPTVPDRCVGMVPEVAPATLEFLFDSTRAIVNLIFSGTSVRFPDIRFVFSHCGGTLPMLIDRVAGTAQRRPEIASRLPNGFMGEIRRMYFDVASVANPGPVAALRHMVGGSQILFGSDAPFFWPARTVADLANLDLPSAEKDAIKRDNGLRLLAPAAA